jgi:hypothetical protein
MRPQSFGPTGLPRLELIRLRGARHALVGPLGRQPDKVARQTHQAGTATENVANGLLRAVPNMEVTLRTDGREGIALNGLEPVTSSLLKSPAKVFARS